MKNSNKIKDCCKENKNRAFLSGLIYGLIPHTGCILFIIASILGATLFINVLKPFLMNAYFFYILILLSLIFASLSAAFYLKKHNSLSFEGMKKKWKYLLTMYSSTVIINLLLFIFIFPLLTNISTPSVTGASILDSSNTIQLKVNIPCPGHAPLITNELKSINGVLNVKFSFPNLFDVEYDTTKTNEKEIMSLQVFKQYKATKL